MRSSSQHSFAKAPSASIQRSKFVRSHGYKTTFDAGYLIPFFADEVLPGDSFNVRAHIFCRMNTPLFPIMDNAYLDTFYFFVPNRLIWDNWPKFMGEQKNPGDSTDYEVPVVTNIGANGFQVHSIADYLGMPTGVPGLVDIMSLYFRAYNLIYNEWFRDENLQDSVPVPLDDGPDDYSQYVLLRRGKRHDYFTSCLPWPQKGPGVELPLGGTAPVLAGPTALPMDQVSTPMSFYNTSSFSNTGTVRGIGVSTASGVVIPPGTQLPMDEMTNVATEAGSQITGPSNLYADLDLATASGFTINTFRQAFQLQRMLERDARSGTRYTEVILSHFGIRSPDSRLQRPEYLGGGSTPLIINPVAQTASTDATSPQGNLAGYGLISGKSGFSRAFVEHGVIIGLLMVRADLTYQQGLERKFTRRGRYDYFWPTLAHLGEQAVLNREIFAQGNDADMDVFGYQERFAEYRFFNSQITGKFRSTDPQPLDSWHLAQKFDTLPPLNEDFIQEAPPFDRVVAIQSEPNFLMDSLIEMTCARPMPLYGIPGLVDHF